MDYSGQSRINSKIRKDKSQFKMTKYACWEEITTGTIGTDGDMGQASK
jgi:hypothetical protein